MKPDSEFPALASRRHWDKDIAVWIGSPDALRKQVPATPSAPSIEELDLLDLFDEKSLPDSDEDAAVTLRQALRKHLSEHRPPDGKRRILMVKSAALLAHLNIGLQEFFTWFCSDHCMVVLLLDGVPETLQLPAEFEFNPRSIVDYLGQPDLAKNVFLTA